MTDHHQPAPMPAGDQRFPPVTELAVTSMALVIAGGIYLAAHLPGQPRLTVPTALLVASGVLLLAALASIARIRGFAWPRFFVVARVALLAYLVIAGMLEFVFIHDGTRGSTLVVLTLSLASFALNVPLILGFTVARYTAPRQA